MTHREPWSRRHKEVTRGARFQLSGSFAETMTNQELVELTLARGDDDLIASFHEHSLEYTPMGGSADLRREIAALYGPQIDEENIVVFAGAQVALQTAARAIIDENSHAIVFTPGYQSVQEAPRHEGCATTVLARRPENGWQIEPAAIEAALRPETRYLVLNEPYNPAGTLMTAALQREVVDLARKHDLIVLSDEVYRFLEHDPADRLPALADVYSKGLSVGTLSKPWGGCGITIGWIALQDAELRRKLIDVQYFGTACPSRASEIQGIMALRASDRILERNLSIVRRNLALLGDFLASNEDLFDWVRPCAGCTAFVRFKGPRSSEQLGQELARAGISIKPAYVFTRELDDYGDWFRVGFGESRSPAALEALAAFVERNRDAW